MRAKRVFSILLAAMLALSLLPSAALAEGDGPAGTGWTPLTDAVSGNITSTTNYCLESNVVLSGAISAVGADVEVTIDLKGHKLSGAALKTMQNGTLTILDSVGGGSIEQKNAIQPQGGTVNIIGGTIDGQLGSAIRTNSSGTVINISGGTLTSNGTSSAAVYVAGDELHISGGTIGDENTKYSVQLAEGAKLYLSGEPTFAWKSGTQFSAGAAIYLAGSNSNSAINNAIHAADGGDAYTGEKLNIALSGSNWGFDEDDGNITIVQDVSVANYNKFTLLGIADGKSLNFDETYGTLVYGNYVPYVPKHTHGVAGGDGTQVWTEWTGGAFADAGYYYLTDDVNLGTSAVTISKDVHLCLNGQTITGSGSSLFAVNSGGSLTICDCAEGGAITNTSTQTSKYVIKAEGGALTLYSGAVNSDKGRGIYVDDGSEVTIAGGSITANQYAGIYILDGSLNMSGGTLTYHCLNGILSSNEVNTVSITGGKILAGDVNPSVKKTGINMSKGALTVSGSPTITGTEYGINVGTATAAITGGTISADGTNGYGLNINGTASVSLGGSPVITGKSNAADICLDRTANAPSAAANGQAYTGAALKIRYNSNAAADGDIIVKGVTPENEGKFTLVYPEGKYLVPSEGNLILSSTPPVTGHTHDVTGGSSGQAVTWTAWEGTTPLNTDGYYYLTGNAEPTAAIEVTADVHLCLNGNTISRTSGNEVFSVTGKLTICDCQGDGKVSISGSSNRAAVRLESSGKLTLYGGTLDGGSGNGVFASGSSTKVTITGGAVMGKRDNGCALGLDSATATITGGTVEGVRLQGIYGKLYLGGNPSVGPVLLYTTDGSAIYKSQIHAVANDVPYTGNTITINTKYKNMAPDTDIVYNVNDDNASKFTLTDYQLERKENNLVIAKNKDITLNVTVPALNYGDTKPLEIEVVPADATLTYKVTGKTPLDQSTAIKVENGKITAGAVGNFILTVTATADGYNQKEVTVEFTVGKAALTVTADDKTIAYGDAAPAFTVTYDGFVNGDDEGDLGGTLAFACDYEKGDDVGTYPITPSGLTSDNYNITFVPGTLTVGKANYPGTVTPPTGLTATYGDTLADVTLPENDDGVWSWKDEDTTSVGNAGGNSFTLIFTPNDTNYNQVEVEATVTVGKAALTVTADNVTIAYGEPKPDFTAQITGFVNGEGKGDLTGTLEFDCAYVAGSPVGTYPIKPKGLTSNNYSISFVDGTLTVTENAVPMPTAPVGKTLTYNSGLQDLIIPGSAEHGTMVYSISQNGPWNAAVPQAKDAGVYTVWYKVVGDPGYSDTAPNSVTAVINKAPLTIKALDRRAYVGERMPAFAYDVVGLLGSDTLDKAPSFSCNANMNMPGTYVIRIFGAEAANYDISYVNGILTVEHRFVIPGYKITVVVVGKGEASASAGWADAGSVISVISKADAGYTLGSITVETESGRSVAMKDGKFTMPNDSVVVTVTFEKKGEPFYDVRPGDWFYDAVIWAYENGIMDGMDIGWFQPDGTVSRAMAVTVLYRMEGQPAVSGSSGFTDVVSGSWYDDAVTWASKNGIVLGVTEDTYRPNDPVTREQLAAILFRYADYKGYDRSASADLTGYADYAEVSAYAVPALRWACGCGIIDGSAGKLDPRSGATRAQLATMLMRFDKAAK